MGMLLLLVVGLMRLMFLMDDGCAIVIRIGIGERSL